MNFFNWLFGRSPTATDPAPQWPASVSARDPRIILAGNVDPEPQDARDASKQKPRPRVELEPVYTMIDYRDAQGIETRRRITMRRIETTAQGANLIAICHERRALRSFRIDRIVDFIETDGEVVEPAFFFREFCAVDIHNLPAEAATKPIIERRPRGRPRGTDRAAIGRAARAILKTRLELLVLAARADDELHPAEIEEIQRFAEDELRRLDATGALAAPVTIEIVDPICKSIPRMRPLREDIADMVQKLAALSPDEMSRFVSAMSRVIRADGVVALSEELFLANMNSAASALRDGGR